MPYVVVTESLLLKCYRIGRSQPVCHLRMYKIESRLTGDRALIMSKNAKSLYLNRSFLPVKFLKNIVRQLAANCGTLQWVQLRWIDLYNVEEDLTKLLRALVVHYDEGKGTSLNQMDLRMELRHNNLSENFEKEMKKLWGSHRTRFVSFHCSQQTNKPPYW